MLYGRDSERAAIEGLLGRARDGRSGVLVLRGEAGIGKTALLEHAASAADGMRVLRGTGVEYESGMPYAGLHLLLRRHLDKIDDLPAAQARALRAALNLPAPSDEQPSSRQPSGGELSGGRSSDERLPGGQPSGWQASGGQPSDGQPSGGRLSHEYSPGGRLAGESGGWGRVADGGDRFLVGLAVLTLLADLAEDRPLLCLVDDAHWLDGASAEALLFAARRLEAEPIAMLFAARDADAPEFPAPGFPELRLRGLDRDAARDLLARRALPPHVEHEILAEAMGNPLALLELDGMRAGRAADRSSAYERIRRGFAERLAALPEPTQALVLLVVSDDLGDVGVVMEAAAKLGASMADLEPAERHGLLRAGADGRLEVRHPLIRTAVYEAAPLSRRIAAHRAVAGVYLERGDACHHAWHLARSVTGPDEAVAAVLEATAEREHGGNAAVAAMYEAAAELSTDPARRGRRLAVAACASADAGLGERAVGLALRAEADLDDPLARADLTLIRASLADDQDRTKEAYRMFADTAASVAALDPRTSGYLFFQAASAAANAGDFAALDRLAARGTELGLPNASHLRALGRVFAGQDPLAGADGADGVAALRELMDAMTDCSGPRDRVRAGMWQLMLGDVAAAAETAAALETLLRARGAIGLLAHALMLRSRTHLFLGRPREARTSAAEGLRIAADTGQHRIRVYLSTVLALLAAMEGDEAGCAELTEEAIARAVPPSSAHAAAARGLLDLGLGRHESAFERLSDVVAGPNGQGAIGHLPDLVEAAVRAGRPERARDAASWYGGWAAQVGFPDMEAIALRCAALLEPDADATFARAVELHRRGVMPFERARTELLYGEWLRRARRRNDARALLHSALEAFERLGAVPWADRARAELRAAGESVATGKDRASGTTRPSGNGTKRTGGDPVGDLTPQELQVVRLAARGLSNREIGAHLFLSPRTVGYHLYKAYPKLGVASRGELPHLNLG
ncbi:helix-turn-helix transcriptional regulator [Actinomadura roseirufa]|uniref:helix-turn-helix transcriptional regulator n=1 Tax=Actinomadura roseirufa TaxID=2094049 RepID=UPI0010419E69|nr:LuxR family transcriptional regulator [Actinomadura roseirufa]